LPEGWLPAADASLTASPNPVSAGAALGKTTLSWRSRSYPDAAIYVSVDGKAETLFAEGSEGESEANWIQAENKYDSRLYADKTRTNTLAQRFVTGLK
jgi:hypothetical protein